MQIAINIFLAAFGLDSFKQYSIASKLPLRDRCTISGDVVVQRQGGAFRNIVYFVENRRPTGVCK